MSKQTNAEYIGEKYYCPYCEPVCTYKPTQLEPHWTIHKNNHVVTTHPKQPHSREQLAVAIMEATGGKYTDEQEESMLSLIETYTAQQSLKRAKEELEKIGATDITRWVTNPGGMAGISFNVIDEAINQLDKEMKASRLDAEGGE